MIHVSRTGCLKFQPLFELCTCQCSMFLLAVWKKLSNQHCSAQNHIEVMTENNLENNSKHTSGMKEWRDIERFKCRPVFISGCLKIQTFVGTEHMASQNVVSSGKVWELLIQIWMCKTSWSRLKTIHRIEVHDKWMDINKFEPTVALTVGMSTQALDKSETWNQIC